MSNTAPAKQVCKPKKLPFVIMCILSAIVAVLNVLLCVLVPKYYTTINSFLYKGPDADKVAAFRQASADMTQKVESEGIVMLENKNQTLPLASGSKINLFGYGSRDTVYGGSGSGSGDSSNNITLEQGLTNAGFSVNPELVSFYNDHFVERTGVGFTGNNFDINEPAVNEYSDEMIANAKAYSDVAVFVVSRLGGEGADLPMDMDPNATTHIVSSGKDIEQVVKGGDAGKHYLELQSVEQQVLDMLKENFGTVVVLVNSTNAMELGFLEDEGVDAAELLQNKDALGLLLANGNWSQTQRARVNLSLPKFDVSSDLDILDTLAQLGMTDVMDGTKSDFTPLAVTDDSLALTQAKHAARVKIDEEGCEAAAFTAIMGDATSAMPEDLPVVEMELDRPFAFAITGADGLPLFVGAVNTME